MYHVKRASDVAKIFAEQKAQIKRFAKQNRLSFSKRNREQSLIKVIKSVSGSPKSNPHILSALANHESRVTRSNYVQPITIAKQVDNNKLITGIPVLDNDSVIMSSGSKNTKTYIIPGVTKAKRSIADDQELAEIVVVAGRQSAVKSTTMGSEKFKPQLLKNIPSAFGESDIMKVVLTLPGVTTVGEASSGYNVRG
jgi:hypothetical protein